MPNTTESTKSQQSDESSISEVDNEEFYEQDNSITDNLKGLINQEDIDDEVRSAIALLDGILKKKNTKTNLVQRENAELKKEIKTVKATSANNESITELVTKETLLLETLVREKQPWRQMDDSMHGWTNVNWLDEINIRRIEKLSDAKAIEKSF